MTFPLVINYIINNFNNLFDRNEKNESSNPRHPFLFL